MYKKSCDSLILKITFYINFIVYYAQYVTQLMPRVELSRFHFRQTIISDVFKKRLFLLEHVLINLFYRDIELVSNAYL